MKYYTNYLTVTFISINIVMQFKNGIMKTINYRGYTIEKQLTGWFTVFTSRYGYLKSDTLAGIKQMINHAIKAPQY